MKQHHTWMALAFALMSAGGAASAQSSAKTDAKAQSATARDHAGAKDSDNDSDEASDEASDDGDEQAAAPADTEASSVLAADDKAGDDRTWRHLYGMQVDGVKLSALDKSQIKQLQQALQEQGYYTAAVDGKIGPKTRLALRQYFLDQAELAAQDLIMPRGAASLGLDEADVERVRGEEDERKDAAIERTRGEDKSDKTSGSKSGAGKSSSEDEVTR